MKLVCYGKDVPADDAFLAIEQDWVARAVPGRTADDVAILWAELVDEGHCDIYIALGWLDRDLTLYEAHPGDRRVLCRRMRAAALPPPEMLPYFHPEEETHACDP